DSDAAAHRPRGANERQLVDAGAEDQSGLHAKAFRCSPMAPESSGVSVRMTRAGTPATTLKSGTSFVTTLPAAMRHPLPIVTPATTTTFAQSHVPRPTRMGLASYGPKR